MRIGFLLPAVFSVGNPGSGVLQQALKLAEALDRRGHTVLKLNPWQHEQEGQLDVLHFFQGGPHFLDIERHRRLTKPGLLVLSPFVDSVQSFSNYRIAAAVGNLHRRFLTIPGIIKRQARGSDLVVCQSTYEQKRMVTALGVPASRTEVVLHGCNFETPTAEDIATAKLELNLPEQFVLHVSAYTQERKNVLRLAAASEELGYPLVLAGNCTPGPILAELQLRAQRWPNLRLLPFVSEGIKNALFKLCKVFCLPSTYEGAGLSAIEAGRAGANLVVTKNGGPPDYFLNHAFYVDPFSPRDIARGLQLAWTRERDDGLTEHIEKNLTWDRSALVLETAYLRHLANSRSPKTSDAR